MYRFSPKHKNSIAPALSAILSVYFILSWLLPLGDIEALKIFLLPIRISGLLSLSVGIYLAMRCFLIKYLYELEPDPQNEGELLLTITETRGKKHRVVCRIGTADIESFEKLQRRSIRRRKDVPKSNKPKNARIYNYCVDLCPDAHIIVLRDDAACRDGEKKEAVVFMPDEKMAEIIKRYVARGN